MRDYNNQRALLEAVAKYWQGYASAQEAESPYSRSWSSETLARGIVHRALAMLDAHIFVENRQHKSSEEYVRLENVIHVASYRNWSGIRFFLVGIEAVPTGDLPQTILQVISKALEESLVVCIMPSSYVEAWHDFVCETKQQHRFVVTLYPVDIDAIAKGRLTLFDLIEYKLYRQSLLDKPENETQFSETSYLEFAQETPKRQSLFVDLGIAIEAQGDQPAKWAEHPKLDSVAATLRANKDCLLVGPSSSGKSTLAFQSGRRLKAMGFEVKYIDSGAVSPQLASHALTLLRGLTQQENNILLVIDDIQSSPSVARYILTMTRLLRLASSAESLVVLAISWPSYAEQVRPELRDWAVVTVLPSETQRALITKYKDTGKVSNIDTISAIAGDDILVWRLILDAPRLQASGLSKQSIANEIWVRKIKAYRGDVDIVKRVVLITAILGRYELELSEGFLEYQTGVSKSSLTSMYKSRILRRNRNKIVLGHRSLCSLLADFLSLEEEIWSYFRNNGKPSQPVDVVQEFIRSVDATEVWAILKTLRAQVGFKDIAHINRRAQTLADAWQAIDSLVERIEQQQAIDFTWGKTLSSAVFAIEALCAVGKRDKARQSLEFIRSHWQLEDEGIEILSGTSERYDFDRILLSMQEEDSAVGVPFATAQTAQQLDPDRFHSTWVRGLILCVEAAYKDRKQNELEKLAILVEQTQEPAGNFYPSRVPWCTARVLMGLARCGRNYTNSPAVKNACDWLLRPTRAGGVYQDGVWESGTGAWNTAIETTAMCTIALILSGLPADDPRLSAAWKFLLSRRNEWTKPEQEIDGVLALNAHVAVTGDWQDVTNEVNYLLKWARGEAFWDSAAKTAKETFNQSLRVAFIAATLVDIVWSTLRFSLSVFLDAFAVPQIALSEREYLGHAGTSQQLFRTLQSMNGKGATKMISILFLAADPTDASRLRLGEELREIQERLQLAKLREKFQLHQRMSVRPADISQALLDVQPQIIHFSGHGTSTGALCFEDKVGKAQPVGPDALAALFEQFANQVNCVLLNACYSESQANAIVKHIPYVIGMNQSIGDKAAIAFAIGFYQALGAGRTIEDSYKLGCVQIRLQSIPEHLTPVLVTKEPAA